ncbi:MAG: phosphoribosyl-ATP diphosphatase [Spirochaetales bacterium]|nr:phosphoribosyl-ATP diphosphatase [Spirochaetales bacterium]MCF7938956.1 phosphoribosyl-ATP diphosphatase [Spirochaetales bacterium]
MDAGKPFVVITMQGAVETVLEADTKAYAKSVEHSSIWYRHGETGRLIPYETASQVRELRDRGEWYEAILEDRGSEAESKSALQQTTQAGGTTPSGRRQETGEAEDLTGGASDVLSRLIRVIRGRKESLPEGSYTTYLFQKGTEKIKKKTGEEAVELILAETAEELSYEAADLVYHMLVLFESRGIPFKAVLDELRSREG